MTLMTTFLSACVAPEPSAPISSPVPPEPPSDWSYTLGFQEAPQQLLRVVARSPDGCGEWWMPTWIPGSYVLREFARNVQEVRAWGPDGELPVSKVAKNRWKVRCEQGPVTLSYGVWSAELSVRTGFVDGTWAVLNAPAWALVPPKADGPVTVALDGAGPGPWTALDAGGPGRVRADSLAQLMDSPILTGPAQEATFEVDGVPYRVVIQGADAWDLARTVDDLTAVARAQHAFWGGPPAPSYTFLVAALGGRGGLEHGRSSLLQAEPHTHLDPTLYDRFLSTASHELFHAWNVKRVTPSGLVPVDWEHEQHTPDLWVAEGLTSYYDDLLLARAGRIDEAAYLDRLEATLRRVTSRPGAEVQALSDASFDAWTEHYRPDAHTRNQSVSYYDRGAVVGWLLDARIRVASDGRASLDDLMRALLAAHDGRAYAPADVRRLADEVAGADLGDWLAARVDRPGELPLDEALATFGLRWAPPPTPATGAWHGATFTLRDGRLTTTEVLSRSPAWEAGLQPDDELIAVDGWRVDGEHPRVDRHPPGTAVTWTVARRGRLRELPLTLAPAPVEPTLEVDPDAPLGAVRARRLWLGASP